MSMNVSNSIGTSVTIHGFGLVRLAFAQVCADAVIGWDVEREALAVLNLSAIERATGLVGAKDSALDCVGWLGCGVGLELSVLASGTLDRRLLLEVDWPWLGFAAEFEEAARGERFEVPWPAISAVWITADGMSERLAI